MPTSNTPGSTRTALLVCSQNLSQANRTVVVLAKVDWKIEKTKIRNIKVQNHSTSHYSPSFDREIKKFEAWIFWVFSKNVAIFNQSRRKLAKYNIEKMIWLWKYIKIGKKCEFFTKNQVFKKWWIMLDLIWRHLLSN